MKKPTHVILSGGAGSRLWPLSRKSRTKQFLPLFDHQTLFEIALSNNRDITDNVIVIGNQDNYTTTIDLMAKANVTPYEIIVEAVPRNTAAAIAFAALSVHPSEVMLITPSDQMIEDKGKYHKAVNEAVRLALQNQIVTFGIKPHKPETGYGYIQANEQEVISFHEKPTTSMAIKYLEDGNYFWNSGIFCFQAQTFLEELEQFRPDILAACRKAMAKKKNTFLEVESSLEIPSESIDYAVMEKSKRIKMVRGDFYWSDLGSFEALYEYFKPRNKYVVGTNLVIAENLKIELQGIENTLIIQSKENLLMMPLSESQEVKKIYERLVQSEPDRVK